MVERDPDRILGVLESWGVRLELGRVENLLDHFGRPERTFSTILVAGTNGKGSTAALLASIVAAGAYRTGLFTSPHLESVEERLRIDGVAIGRSALADLLREILGNAETAGLEPPTYFEALTLAGVLWFARSEVDLAVFEVGMGGRLDATNSCSPSLSVVTEIGIDHSTQLGETLGAIAREKAGIFRPGVAALSGATAAEARDGLAAHAHELGTPLQEVADSIQRVSSEPRDHGQFVRVQTRAARYELELALPGEHQLRNLLVAVAAAERLAAEGWSGLDRPAIEEGVRRCRWPGRLEKVVLPTGKTVWLDAAHNPQGAKALAEFLTAIQGDFDLLFGILSDKDARAVLEAVSMTAARIVLTSPPSDRALDPETLRPWLPHREVQVEAEREKALEALLDGDAPLVVCGSLYLVGWARTALRERFGLPSRASEALYPPDPQAQA
ncbi:MAG: bifunctional folylpolyglutamate synthase/dihydrofolate synthase [Thermoanaerobaculia bacterium]